MEWQTNWTVCADFAGNSSSWHEAQEWLTRIGYPVVLFVGLLGHGVCFGALWHSSTASDLKGKNFLRSILAVNVIYLLVVCSTEGFLAISSHAYDVRSLIDCNTYQLFRGVSKLLSSWWLILLLLQSWNIINKRAENQTHVGLWLTTTFFVACGLNWHCFGGLETGENGDCEGKTGTTKYYNEQVYPWIEVITFYYLPCLCGLILTGALLTFSCRSTAAANKTPPESDKQTTQDTLTTRLSKIEETLNTAADPAQPDTGPLQKHNSSSLLDVQLEMDVVRTTAEKAEEDVGDVVVHQPAEEDAHRDEERDGDGETEEHAARDGEEAAAAGSLSAAHDLDPIRAQKGSDAALEQRRDSHDYQEVKEMPEREEDEENIYEAIRAPYISDAVSIRAIDGSFDRLNTTNNNDNNDNDDSDPKHNDNDTEGHENDGHDNDGHNNDGPDNDGHDAEGHDNEGLENEGHDNGHEEDKGNDDCHIEQENADELPDDVLKRDEAYYQSPMYKVAAWRYSVDTQSSSTMQEPPDTETVIDTMKKIWQDTYRVKRTLAAMQSRGQIIPEQLINEAEKVSIRGMDKRVGSLKGSQRPSQHTQDSPGSSRLGSGRLHSRRSTLRIKGKQGWVRRKTDSRTISLSLLLFLGFILLNMPQGVSFMVFRALEAGGSQPTCGWYFVNQLGIILNCASFSISFIFFFASLELIGVHYLCTVNCFSKA